MELGLLALAAAIIAAAVIASRRSGQTPPGWGDVAGGLAAGTEASRTIQARLDEAVTVLAGLTGALEERRRMEERTTEAVVRLERLVTGSHSRGRAGENLLGAALSELPPDLLVRDLTVGGRTCEFALRLPDRRLLPIDSKWSAMEAVAEWESETDPARREALRKQVERAVLSRVREVSGYLDPSLTAPIAVVALPDAVYGCVRKAHSVAAGERILLVGYSLAVPFLLGLWCLYRTFAGEVDADRLAARLHEVGVCLSDLRERLEGKLSRALTTAGNAVLEMRSLATAAETSLAAIRRSADPGAGEADLEARVDLTLR